MLWKVKTDFTYVLPHSEAHTFNWRIKKKSTFFEWRGAVSERKLIDEIATTKKST